MMENFWVEDRFGEQFMVFAQALENENGQFCKPKFYLPDDIKVECIGIGRFLRLYCKNGELNAVDMEDERMIAMCNLALHR